MSFLKIIKSSVVKMFSFINKFPMENIELVFAVALVSFGITVALPLEWLPAGSAYSNNIAKLVFGVLIAFPGFKIIYWRIRHGIEKYIIAYQVKRQRMLFVGSLAWLYLGSLRIISAPWYPPYYIMYLSLFAIGITCYVRLYK